MTWTVTLDLTACALESPVALHVQLSRSDVLGTSALTRDLTCASGETCSTTIVMDHLFVEIDATYEGRFNFSSTGGTSRIAGFGVRRTRCSSLVYFTTCPAA